MLYLRVFAPVRWFRVAVFVAAAAMTLCFSISPILAVIYCTPRPGGHWDLGVELKCGDLAFLAIMNGVFNLLSDLLIIVLPLPILYRLNLATKKKYGLAVVFLAGILYDILAPARFRPY